MAIHEMSSEASLRFSREVVQYLRKTMTLKKIGELIDRGESFVSLVGKGKRNLTISHLISLEKRLGKPLPVLILEASKKSLSRDMRRRYDSLHEVLEKSGGLRAHMAKKGKRK